MSLKLKIDKVYYEKQENGSLIEEQLIKCLVRVYLEDQLLRTVYCSGDDQNVVSRVHSTELESDHFIDNDQEFDFDLNGIILNKKDKLHFECYYIQNEEKIRFFKKKR